MGNTLLAPSKPKLISKQTYDAWVNRVWTLAIEKSTTVGRGEEFEVTLPPAERPEGAHYGEIAGTLVFGAAAYGLQAHAGTGWTYPFTKL